MEKEEDINTLFTGALDDFRSEADRAKDYTADELVAYGEVSLAPLNVATIPHFAVKGYYVRDQDGSNTCVAQTRALMQGIERYREQGVFVDHSAADIYQRRSNKPYAGMIGVDAFELVRKGGVTLEALMPSQKVNDEKIMEVPRYPVFDEVGKVFAEEGYAQVPFDAKKISSLMAGNIKRGLHKPMMMWFRFPYSEWTGKPVLSNNLGAYGVGTEKYVHHSVTGIHAGMIDGEIGFAIQDSWGLHSTTQGGIRLITASYLAKRMTFCGYAADFTTQWQGNDSVPDIAKPKHVFNVDLTYGMENHVDVRALQNILKFEQMYPVTQEATGNYGPLTAKGVVAWQTKNKVGTPEQIAALSGTKSRVGPATRAKLNETYGQ